MESLRFSVNSELLRLPFCPVDFETVFPEETISSSAIGGPSLRFRLEFISVSTFSKYYYSIQRRESYRFSSAQIRRILPNPIFT